MPSSFKPNENVSLGKKYGRFDKVTCWGMFELEVVVYASNEPQPEAQQRQCKVVQEVRWNVDQGASKPITNQ